MKVIRSFLILALGLSFYGAAVAQEDHIAPSPSPTFTKSDMEEMAKETVKSVSSCKELKVMPVMETGNFKNSTDENIDKGKFSRLINAGLKKVRPASKLAKGEKKPRPPKLWVELSSEKTTEGSTASANYKLKFNTLDNEDTYCAGEYEIKKTATN